jgi:hypothetical protein
MQQPSLNSLCTDQNRDTNIQHLRIGSPTPCTRQNGNNRSPIRLDTLPAASRTTKPSLRRTTMPRHTSRKRIRPVPRSRPQATKRLPSNPRHMPTNQRRSLRSSLHNTRLPRTPFATYFATASHLHRTTRHQSYTRSQDQALATHASSGYRPAIHGGTSRGSFLRRRVL